MNESTWSNKAVGFDRFVCAIFIQPLMRKGRQMREKSRVLTRHQLKVKHEIEIRISDSQQNAKSKNEFEP